MKWRKKLLGDYIDILPGFAFKTKDFSDEGVPIVKIKNITPPNVSLEDLTYVSDEIAQKSEKFMLSYNDVLIAMTGSHINQWASVVGRVARVKYKEKSLLNQRVGKIIVKDQKKANIDYIYYFLQQDETKVMLANQAGGAANQANISPLMIKRLEFPAPDIEVQNKIADILSAYDDLIENNQKQIKLLEEAAQRLYKEWFVDLRFPGYEQTRIIDGVPEGWKKGCLGDIAEFKRGKTITKTIAIDGNIPVVAGGTEPAYYHNIANTKAPVITVSASGANAGFVRMYHKDVFASDCSFVDTNTTEYLPFVYCFMVNNKAQLDILQKGSAQPHVYAKDINAIMLNIPNVNIIYSFCENTKSFFDKVKILEQSIRNLKEARDRLLPKLMSGEIEV